MSRSGERSVRIREVKGSNPSSTFYKSFIVLSLIENTADIPDGDPEITATYRYFDKSDVDVVEFYRASGRRYTVVVNGQVLGNTVTSGMETALESMELLIQGEEVPDTVG